MKNQRQGKGGRVALKIEPTEEMMDRFLNPDLDACDNAGCRAYGCMKNRLTAVIEIIQRDYYIRPMTCDQPYPADHGAKCDGERGHEHPHYARFVKDVTWE